MILSWKATHSCVILTFLQYQLLVTVALEVAYISKHSLQVTFSVILSSHTSLENIKPFVYLLSVIFQINMSKKSSLTIINEFCWEKQIASSYF